MRFWRRVLLVLALLLAGTSLASCTAARNGLGTDVSQCFRVLPAARAAAGTSSKFDGVRSLQAGALLRAVSAASDQGRPPAPPARLAAVAHASSCLVAFRGTFRLAGVTHGWAPAPGPYLNAIVVVRQSNGDLVATVLFRRLPRGIRFFRGTAFTR
jgi:predicted small secreted protein